MKWLEKILTYVKISWLTWRSFYLKKESVKVLSEGVSVLDLGNDLELCRVLKWCHLVELLEIGWLYLGCAARWYGGMKPQHPLVVSTYYFHRVEWVGILKFFFRVKIPVLSCQTSSLLKLISMRNSLNTRALALPTFRGGHSSLILNQSLMVSSSDFNLRENLLADLAFFLSEKGKCLGALGRVECPWPWKWPWTL